MGEEGKVPFGYKTYPLHFCVNIANEGESLKRQFKEPYKTVEPRIKLVCNSPLMCFHYGKVSHPARSKSLLAAPPAPSQHIWKETGMEIIVNITTHLRNLEILYHGTCSTDVEVAKKLILTASSRVLHMQGITSKGISNTISETTSPTFQWALPLHWIYKQGKKTLSGNTIPALY